MTEENSLRQIYKKTGNVSWGHECPRCYKQKWHILKLINLKDNNSWNCAMI